MISELQLLANQLNGQKSTGPRTEAGKNIARFNARRHGLTGQFYCMSEGDEAAYNGFEASMLTDLKPVGPYESQLAISIIQDQWRLNRSRGVEFNLIGIGHEDHAEYTHAPSPNTQAAATMAATWQIDDRRFANIALYETRIHRMIARNRKELRQLQDERRAAEADALAEAELLTRLALMNGEKLSPADAIEVNHAKGNVRLVARAGLLPTEIEANGFVFSKARILQIINRKELLLEAQHHAKSGWSPNRPYSTDRFRFPLAA